MFPVRRIAFVCLALLTACPAMFAGEAWPRPPTSGDCVLPGELVAERPTLEGKPTRVEIGLYVIDVKEIDDVSQTFTADIHLSARWQDARLSEESLGYSLEGCVLGLNDIWHPHLMIVNELDLARKMEDRVMVDAEGNCHYRQRFIGHLSTRFDLRDFPFDEQVLDVRIVSARYDSSQVVLAVDPKRTGRLESMSIAGWSIELGTPELPSEHIASLQAHLPRIDFRIRARREGGFYVWKVLLPLCLIIFMAWTAFWFDPEQLSLQVRVATSAVLTLIAFMFSLTYLLPRISYLTRIDRFILGSSVLIFLTLAETIFVHRVSRRGNAGLTRRIDLVSRWLYIVALALIGIYSFWF